MLIYVSTYLHKRMGRERGRERKRGMEREREGDRERERENRNSSEFLRRKKFLFTVYEKKDQKKLSFAAE